MARQHASFLQAVMGAQVDQVLTGRQGRRLDRQRRPVAQSRSLRVPPEVVHGVQFRGRPRQ